MAQPRHPVADHGIDFVCAQADRPADAAMQARELGHADQADPFAQVGLEEAARAPLCVACLPGIADVQRGMRPSGLRQVLDGHAEAALPFDEQHVARAQAGHEALRIGRRRDAVRMVRAGQVAAQPLADPSRDAVQDARHGDVAGDAVAWWRISGRR